MWKIYPYSSTIVMNIKIQIIIFLFLIDNAYILYNIKNTRLNFDFNMSTISEILRTKEFRVEQGSPHLIIKSLSPRLQKTSSNLKIWY